MRSEDCDLLHAGVDAMRKNTNPFTGGINFDETWLKSALRATSAFVSTAESCIVTASDSFVLFLQPLKFVEFPGSFVPAGRQPANEDINDLGEARVDRPDAMRKTFLESSLGCPAEAALSNDGDGESQ